MNNNGFVVSSTGERTPVVYELQWHREAVPDGRGGSIPGMGSSNGRIDPACCFGDAVLEMADGLKLKIIVKNQQGSFDGSGVPY